MSELSSLGLIDSHAHIQGSEYASEVEAVVKYGPRETDHEALWAVERLMSEISIAFALTKLA